VVTFSAKLSLSLAKKTNKSDDFPNIATSLRLKKASGVLSFVLDKTVIEHHRIVDTVFPWKKK